jgi:ribosome biogenesis GTPase
LAGCIQLTEGRILTSVGGFYTVNTDSGIITCKARGIFRKDSQTPFVGDYVLISIKKDSEAVIEEILPRKNEIIRPPTANIDVVVLVVSLTAPSPNFEVIDKFTAVTKYKRIKSVIAVTKTDIGSKDSLQKIIDIYDKKVADVYPIDYREEESYKKLYFDIAGQTAVFTGNTGVGKSTLLNHLDESLSREVGEVSRKLGRGKHTTRTVSLFRLQNGAYAADTPGFGVFDTTRYALIPIEELAGCFSDFSNLISGLGSCRYADCTHTKEVGCKIIEAVQRGEIPQSRYNSYRKIYEELASVKHWEIAT